MTLLIDQTTITEDEIENFEIISQNSSGIICKGGIVVVPKSIYEHLAVDDYEHILMKFVEVQKNNTEIPKTLLMKARKTSADVKISGRLENYIFDDTDTVYLNLLKGHSQASAK